MKKKKIELVVGDIVSIDLQNGEFAFARVLAKVDIGHVIEVFNFFSTNPKEAKQALNSDRLFYPQVIDSYSIFYIGNEGKWDVVEAGKGDSDVKDVDDLRFRMGTAEELRLVDVNGREEKRSIDEMDKYPWYSPGGDANIRRLIQFFKDKK